MGKGSYIVAATSDNKNISFKLHPNLSEGTEIPEDESDFMFEVQKTLTVIEIIFANDEQKFKHYFDQLLKLSQVALVPPMAQLKLAKKALVGLQQEIVEKESGKIKNNYLRRLGLRALILLLVGASLRALLSYLIPATALTTDLIALALIWMGCMIGVWLSFAIRRVRIPFYNLHILEEDRLEPVIRLVYAGILSVILGFLLLRKGAVIEIGDISSEQIITDPLVAMLFGAILGISEQTLGNTVAQKASKMVGDL